MDPTILRWLLGDSSKLGPALPTPRREVAATSCLEEEEFSEGAALDSGGHFLYSAVTGPWAPRAEVGAVAELEIGQAEPLGSLVATCGITPPWVSVWVGTRRPFTAAPRTFTHLLPSAGPGNGPRKKVLL